MAAAQPQRQQFTARALARAVQVAIYMPPGAPRPAPKPEPPPQPAPESELRTVPETRPAVPFAAMGLDDLLRHCVAHPPNDPLTARLVEVIECEVAGLEDDLATAEDRREEAERLLAEANGRIERLENVLEDEGVDEKRWR